MKNERALVIERVTSHDGQLAEKFLKKYYS